MDMETAKEILGARTMHPITVQERVGAEQSPELPTTAKAQDYLWSAQNAVESMVGTAFVYRDLTRASKGLDRRGVMGDSEQDILRAALLFACAGLDASLKQLVQDSLLVLSRSDKWVSDELQKFAATYLEGPQATVDTRALVQLLMADGSSPREILVEAWHKSLTSGSLQSAAQIESVCNALGVVDRDFRKRIASNKPDSTLSMLFRARNEITHELDFSGRSSAADRESVQGLRRRRHAGTIKIYVTEVLNIAQYVIDDVAIRTGGSA